MLPRYLRTFLLIALLASALTACGKSSSSPAASQATAVSEAMDQIGEMMPIVDENPAATPSSKAIAPFSLPLEAELPRHMMYASMDWSVTQAMIDNTVISLFDSDKRTDKYRAARITLRINNPMSRYASIDSNIMQLRLGDGKMYKPDDSRPLDLPEGNEETESKLVFRVPADATWQGAALVIREAHKEPAELPLEGPTPKSAFPAMLPGGMMASAQKADYKVVEAALDLDHRGKRIAEGKRFLAISIRVMYNGTANLPVSNDNFRLLIDNAPMAPIDSMMEVVAPNSSKDGMVVFEIPASATSATLQVGEAGQGETGKIRLDLMAAAASK